MTAYLATVRSGGLFHIMQEFTTDDPRAGRARLVVGADGRRHHLVAFRCHVLDPEYVGHIPTGVPRDYLCPLCMQEPREEAQ